MMIFFDIQGIFRFIGYLKFRPLTRTTTRRFWYTFVSGWEKESPEMWKNVSWLLHQDKAPKHYIFSIKKVLMRRNITVLEHPPYSCHQASWDFFGAEHLSSSLLSKNLKIKTYSSKILPFIYMGLKLGRWNWARNVGWGYLRIGWWGEYFLPKR
jgi:hypothetical protein